MPSWNVHTAHVEAILADSPAENLGIEDVNAFLFGNYAPDVYVGYMVPDVTVRVDYCATHAAAVDPIPVPDADLFWDSYIAYRLPQTPAGSSLVLGAWAHLVADRFFNASFRRFCLEKDLVASDDLRKRKQADFDLFGRSLRIQSHVKATPELVEASRSFVPYSILADDVKRSIAVADAIVEGNRELPDANERYKLLDAAWMNAVFTACNERLTLWLRAWKELRDEGHGFRSTDVRIRAGLPFTSSIPVVSAK